MRKPYVFGVAVAAAAMAGCASGPRGSAPVLRHPAEAATITVVRTPSWIGAPASMYFLVEDRPIYALRMGQSFSFRLDPGEYPIGYNLGFNECRGRLLVEPDYQYRITLTPVCLIDVQELPRTGTYDPLG